MVIRYLVIDLNSILCEIVELKIKEQDNEWSSIDENHPTINTSLVNPLVKTIDMIKRVVHHTLKLIEWFDSVYRLDRMVIVDRGPPLAPRWNCFDKRTKQWRGMKFESLQLVESLKWLRTYKFIIPDEVIKKHLIYQCKARGISLDVDHYSMKMSKQAWRDYHLHTHFVLLDQTHFNQSSFTLIYEYLLFTLAHYHRYPTIHAASIDCMNNCVVISSKEFFKSVVFTNSVNVNAITSSLDVEQVETNEAAPNRLTRVEQVITPSERARSIRRVVERAYGPILDINDDAIIMRLYSSKRVSSTVPFSFPQEMIESDVVSYYPRMMKSLIELLESFGIENNEWVNQS